MNSWPVSSMIHPQKLSGLAFRHVWCFMKLLSTHSSAEVGGESFESGLHLQLCGGALGVESRPQKGTECHGSGDHWTWRQADVLADLDVLCSLARVALTAFGCPKSPQSSAMIASTMMTSIESIQAVHLCSSKVGRVRCACGWLFHCFNSRVSKTKLT